MRRAGTGGLQLLIRVTGKVPWGGFNFGGYLVNQAPQSFQKGFRIHFVKVGRIPSKLFKQFQMSRADDNEDAILAWFRDPIDVCENSQISLVPIGHPSPPFYKLWDRL